MLARARGGRGHLARLGDGNDLRLVPIVPAELAGLAEAITADGTVRTLPSHLPAAEARLSGLDGFFIMRLAKG
jgi:16S rRNA (cytosine967-C5)-methyltransferase